MPKYYCDYCDVFLTHDSSSVRKSHNAGWKHKTHVQNYYNALGKDKIQEVIDQITRNKNDRNFPPLLMSFAKPGMVLPPNYPLPPGTEKTRKQPSNPANPIAPSNPSNPAQPPFPVPPFGKPGQMPPPGMNHPIPGAPGAPGAPPGVPINKGGFPPSMPPPSLGGVPTGAPGMMNAPIPGASGAPGVPGVPGIPGVPGTLPPPGLPSSIPPTHNNNDNKPNETLNAPPGTNKRSHDSDEVNEKDESSENKKIKH
ncbi:zf-U1-domain-containing protein [Neocallimastix lanati (nom. inval.)]|jgi:U1 small nuclear ribonucleoprotein C|uniref:U1 small nuclear ribonucleoprotein C n=1 Tax=Neocallimastix californiae TaxID=1754190 RepID=A0A1Y2AS41_9FUNG|nr:zf-U1-domain-containing protein [Neocallimastix sp. JGI-2020a]ORY25398.1 zf-U1-domain-containing protein [Neocallimastix californiae]|eukprot:ORY25398.1 zf-U1-domain-containing protein [Neocallimastix californiae]